MHIKEFKFNFKIKVCITFLFLTIPLTTKVSIMLIINHFCNISKCANIAEMINNEHDFIVMLQGVLYFVSVLSNIHNHKVKEMMCTQDFLTVC